MRFAAIHPVTAVEPGFAQYMDEIDASEMSFQKEVSVSRMLPVPQIRPSKIESIVSQRNMLSERMCFGLRHFKSKKLLILQVGGF